MSSGFNKDNMRARYDVAHFDEDEWHSVCGARTRRIITAEISTPGPRPNLLLNAGCGVYTLGLPQWKEISVDLFEKPLGGRPDAVCGNIEAMPFESSSFGAIACVGEVLGYCDPARALKEFGRVAAPHATLVCDFGSTLSARYMFTKTYRKTADIASDEYNGTEERIWVYHPEYIKGIIERVGFRILKDLGTHSFGAIACRLGFRQASVGAVSATLAWLPQPRVFSDLRTIVSVKDAA